MTPDAGGSKNQQSAAARASELQHLCCPVCEQIVHVCDHLRAIPAEHEEDDQVDDKQQVEWFLTTAKSHAERGNEFGHGMFVGRALEHADQNAIDLDWLRGEFESRGLDSALVSVPKMAVGRG